MHTAGDPTNLIPAIRREVYAVEPNLPLDSRQTQTEELKDQLGELRSRAWNFTDLMACRSRIIPQEQAPALLATLGSEFNNAIHFTPWLEPATAARVSRLAPIFLPEGW